jgi:hypothetical protein
MARLPSPRGIPWARALEVGVLVARVVHDRWNRLSKREQQDLSRIVRKSRGRLSNITAGERAQLQRLVSKAIGLGR